MKAYLVTVLVVDHDEVGSGLQEIIENTKYSNRCINPRVIDLLEAEIGEWDDDHPLNTRKKDKDVIKQSYQWMPPDA
jgi:hypothetical protein